MKNKFLHAHTFFQLVRFVIIGGSAAAVHFSVVVFFVEKISLAPLVANIIGFCCGFQVSYWGHRSWTFSGTQILHRAAMPRLLLLNLAVFIINESLFFFFLYVTHLPYPIALFIVLSILPLATFTISKLWVFKR